MGVMLVLVWLKYLITAAICCAGIYFLRIKSIFLQIVLFIIGMAILNFIWLQIEMFIMSGYAK